jgi:protein-tyrosine-phosphatase
VHPQLGPQRRRPGIARPLRRGPGRGSFGRVRPGGQINPAVVQILTERGLDASKEFPKPLTDEVGRAADVIVTMGCGDACPVYPGKRYLDWRLTDPAGLPVEAVRPIVDDIDRRVQTLLTQLVPAATI